MKNTISFIVATIGRPTLLHTLKSIDCHEGDEIIVVGKIPPLNDNRVTYIPYETVGGWGGVERNIATNHATGTYLSYMDDDDVYAPGFRLALGMGMLEHPGQPMIFRMRYGNGITLWQDQEIRCGNVGTPMLFMPNVPEKLGKWSSSYAGDFDFLSSMKWNAEDIVWRPEIIAHLRPHE